ncbi:MAG: ABC transporter ATP-binding protein [Phycisphaerae bacterium]|nr:ABC transporter ATP-binding protein [Phycisphaerae bacterium]
MNAQTQEPIVTSRDLLKCYGKLHAVDGVSFDVHPTECVGFLGPNGAGKTTLMRMILSLVGKSGGELNVFGLTPMSQRKLINRHIGVVFQDNNLDSELAAADSLLVHGLYCGLDHGTARKRIADLLAWMELSEKAGSEIRELSGGMVRRLMIARALLNQPRLLILDEPTTGLDPQVRHVIWALLRQLKRQGMTILLTTHYMEEAQQLADRVMIMDHGKVLLDGAPNALVERHLERYVLQAAGLSAIPEHDGDVRHEHAGDADFFYSNTEASLQKLYERVRTPFTVLRHANLEDVFLKFTGHGLTE